MRLRPPFEHLVAHHIANAMEYGPKRVRVAANALRIEARIRGEPVELVDDQERRAIQWLATEGR